MALTKTKKRKRRPDQFRSKALSTRKLIKEDFSLEQVEAFKKLLNFDSKLAEEEKLSDRDLMIGFDEVGRGSIAGPLCTGAYSCSSFYYEAQELLHEISLARQVISDELLDTNFRDSYYAETLVNDLSVSEDLDQFSSLSALLNLEDSKKVSKAKREKLTQALKQIPYISDKNQLFFTTNFEPAKSVDDLGIVETIWISMTNTLVNLVEQYQNLNKFLPEKIVLLVDGPKVIAALEERIKDQLRDIEIKQIAIKKGDSKSSLIAAASNLAKYARDQYMEEIAQDHNDYGWANNAGYGTKRHYQAIEKYGLSQEHRRSYLTGIK